MSINWPKRIDLIVFDFDGVMTDNRVIVMMDGSEGVYCNRADGLGIDMLRKRGIPMMILSTETNPIVVARANKLRLPVIHGVEDKASRLRELLIDNDILPEYVAYVGNDINDLGCLNLVGLPIVVADAHPEVHSSAELMLKRNGGDGAVRELCDMICKQYFKTKN